MKLQNWIVIQEENGYGNAVFDYSIEHNWLFEPVIPAEIKCSEEFTGIEAYIIDECTGQRVNCDISVETKNKRDYKITVGGLPVGPLFSVVKKLCFTEKNGNKYQFSPEIIARHISVGEVYIIAGQSNAEGTAVMNIYEEPKIGVNALSKDGNWDIASHPIGGYGHSPFITFGKAIQRKLNCSVGLIPRAVGGSQISEWIKGGTHFEKLKKEIESEDIKASAVIWYQGCSDTDSCEQTQAYEKNLLNLLVKSEML